MRKQWSQLARHLPYFLLVSLISLVCARGIMTSRLLSGHDSSAYPITQHQFHANIKTGALFPRWAPDMRLGYGHVKLQYRPPLLHYIGETILFFSRNDYLAVNLSVTILIFIAGFGMFFFARSYAGEAAACCGTAAYLLANYFLADVYIRGAYYEIAADAFMPWVLLGQTLIFRLFNHQYNFASRIVIICGTALAWTCVICGHPQITVFFAPLAFSHILMEYFRSKKSQPVLACFAMFAASVLIAAPYVYVAYRELPWVRMELFLTNLETYARHFLDLKNLLFETWPRSYTTYTAEFDYWHRPIHREMRALNLWALAVLILTPICWFGKHMKHRRFFRWSLFFYFWAVATIAIALPLSSPIWNNVSILHMFNFPWRSLNVTTLCVAMLTSLLVGRVLKNLSSRKHRLIGSIAVITVIILFALPKTSGWLQPPSPPLNSESIKTHQGIPQQFYTPKWVVDYPTEPSNWQARVVDGEATIEVTSKEPTKWKLNVNARTPSVIVCACHYYPGWTVDGLPTGSIPTRPWGRFGLISFNVPVGNLHLILELKDTPTRALAWKLCILGLMLAIGYSVVLGLMQNRS